MKTLVKIATVRNFEAACFLKDRLGMENIDCYFVYSGIVADKRNIIKVQVESEDVENAIKIMINTRLEYGKDLEKLKPERTLRKIIVPTDLSLNSEAACMYAIHLAEKLEAEIKLLHVFRNPVTDAKMQSNETFETYLYDIAMEEERKAKEAMLEFSRRIREYAGNQGIKNISIHTTIAMGYLERTIKDIAINYKPDFLVLNTQGRSSGSKSAFSRIAKELVSELHIPLFAIPGPGSAAEVEKMKVLYATDFNENDHSSLNRLLEILKPMKKEITCIHIDTEHNPSHEERMDELNTFLGKEYGKHAIQCRMIDHTDISQGIKDFAEAGNFNLLSFTIHKRGIFEILFMPNLFKKILQEASIPILIFPS